MELFLQPLRTPPWCGQRQLYLLPFNNHSYLKLCCYVRNIYFRPNLVLFSQVMFPAQMCAHASNLPTCIQFVHMHLICAHASNLRTCIQFVHMHPVCAHASNLRTCIQVVHMYPVRAHASNLIASFVLLHFSL